MTKDYDLLVFIGRFQPFHNEHQRIIDIALKRAKHVLVLIGSSGKARTIRNPFTYAERSQMIIGAFPQNQDNITTVPLYDKMYNDAAWTIQVQDAVQEVALDIINGNGFHNSGLKDAKIGLIGASKDHTSFYLKMFPQWDSVPVRIHNDTSSTEIRNNYFNYGVGFSHGITTPTNVHHFLENFSFTPTYTQLQEEYHFIVDYQTGWKAAPYPVKHMTVDAVVEQSGHILVVKRRSEPGKGLLALPGGHLNEFETMLDGAIRELREETMIKVPEPVLRGSIAAQRTFDDPYRSMIGRVITQAFHFKLRPETSLPRVKGSDDAEKAMWIPISELAEEDFFDDHFHIIQYFLGL